MDETNRAISRRTFGRAALVSAAIPALPAAPQRDTGEALTEPQNSEVEARYNNVIRQYGSRLNEEQRQHIRRVLTANERMLSHIREFPLDNGDPMATVLKLAEGGK